MNKLHPYMFVVMDMMEKFFDEGGIELIIFSHHKSNLQVKSPQQVLQHHHLEVNFYFSWQVVLQNKSYEGGCGNFLYPPLIFPQRILNCENSHQLTQYMESILHADTFMKEGNTYFFNLFNGAVFNKSKWTELVGKICGTDMIDYYHAKKLYDKIHAELMPVECMKKCVKI